MTFADINQLAKGWQPPQGVTADAQWHPGCIVLGNGRGWCTVDMQRRLFGLGAAPPRRPGEQFVFKGRGWEQKILSAAVKFLEEQTA